MQVIFAGICVFGGAATIMFISSLDLSGWLKASIIVPLVFLVVYSLARIQPKETKPEKVQANSVVRKSANALLQQKKSGPLEAA
jgi:hypothetical protein